MKTCIEKHGIEKVLKKGWNRVEREMGKQGLYFRRITLETWNRLA